MKKNPSVDDLLEQEYRFLDTPRPTIGSDEWDAWLDQFRRRHPEKVSRMKESLEARAYQVCRLDMPNE